MGNTCCDQKSKEAELNTNMRSGNKPQATNFAGQEGEEEHAARTIQTKWRYNQKKKGGNNKDLVAGGAA